MSGLSEDSSSPAAGTDNVGATGTSAADMIPPPEPPSQQPTNDNPPRFFPRRNPDEFVESERIPSRVSSSSFDLDTRYSDRTTTEDALICCHDRCRTLCRCVCFPVVVVTTLLAILLLFAFVGLPFFIFVVFLLTVYYCCTTDPIPFRTLLRAMIGVGDDWNGTGFSLNPREAYHVTKEDIRKGIIRRQCLGPMESEATVAGGDLATLPKDHPGRVHWRKEDTAVTCLVFSEPLGSSSPAVVDSTSEDDLENPSDEDISQDGETAVSNVPKYLQSHSSGVDTAKDDKGVEEVDEVTESPRKLGSTENPDPVQPIPTASNGESVPDDGSSVRDRGTVCDICLLEFETGEAVAWSPNPECSHAFHEECITDWLMRKPTCPSCRQNFIVLPDSWTDSENDHESDGDGGFDGWGALDIPSSANQGTEDGDIEMGTSSVQQ